MNESNKLKVSLLVANMNGGGAEKSMLNLAKGLHKRGINTDLVLCEAEGEYMSQAPDYLNIIDLKRSRVLYAIQAIADYLKKNKPDVLISTLNRVNIAAVIARKISRVKTKIILREASTLGDERNSNLSLWEGIINTAARIVYSAGDEFVAQSYGSADDLINYTGINQEKVHVIYNPVVDDDIYTEAEKKSGNAWVDEGYDYIISAGRITPSKDFTTLILAFNELINNCNMRLIIIGKQNEKDEYDKLSNVIDNLGLKAIVSLPGFVQNPFPYYKHAKLLVSSSKLEGLPGTLIQAMACGCPVVSTDCPSGPSEILGKGKYGLLSPVGDYSQLAENMIKTLNNPLSSEMLAKRALEFTVEKAVDKYMKVIEKLSPNKS